MVRSNIALPELSFYDWLKGFPCYDRNFAYMSKNPEFNHYYTAFASVSQVCSKCFGCGSQAECILEPLG